VCVVFKKHSQPLASLAYVYGLAGKKAEALKLIAELNDRARHHYVSGVLMAYAYIGLGEDRLSPGWSGLTKP
jgi:hypothetical protein